MGRTEEKVVSPTHPDIVKLNYTCTSHFPRHDHMQQVEQLNYNLAIITLMQKFQAFSFTPCQIVWIHARVGQSITLVLMRGG